MTPLEAVNSICCQIGITPFTVLPLLDERIHRDADPILDKPGKKDRWFKGVMNPDDTVGGTVGHHRLQIQANWHTGVAKTFSKEERARFAQEQAERRKKAAEELAQLQQQAQERAVRTWKAARPGPTPYTEHKGVNYYGARHLDDVLVIDYRTPAGKLSTLQFIKPDGSKRFLAHGIAKGCYHRIGLTSPLDVICLCEGFATGATVHAATGYPVAVCGSAGNLLSVAVAIREKFPKIIIIVCGDADPVGKARAEEAAEAVNGSFVIPDFEEYEHGE